MVNCSIVPALSERTKDYTRAFVAGTSVLVVIPFYTGHLLQGVKSNASFAQYAYAAPLYFGLMNVLGLALATHLGVGRFQRFALTGLLSATVVTLFIYGTNFYPDFSKRDYLQRAFVLCAFHFFAFVFTINALERLV